MEKTNLPNDIALQLQEIKRQNRNFTGVIIFLISVLAVVIGYWFTQNQSYAIIDPGSSNNVVQLNASSGGVSGSSGGGGCCGGGGGGGQVAAPELEKQALEAYKAQFGATEGIKAVVMDLGCHQEVNIIDKDSNLLKRFSYRGGQLTLI